MIIKFFNRLVKVIIFFKYFYVLKNYNWSKIFRNYDVPYDKIEIISNEISLLKELGIIINKNNYKLILHSYYLLCKMKNDGMNKLIIERYDDFSFIFIIGDLRLIITSREEIMIFYEIFYKGLYNFKLQNEVLVLDIGMNVGFTSLFLSTFPNIIEIYSFEPVPFTFKQAENNFSLNEKYSKKIIRYNFGLSSKEYTTEIEFMQDFKGSMGIWGIPPYLQGRNGKIEKVNIHLKNIINILDDLSTKDYPMILKIDCEGAEYQILNAIDQASKFKKIKLIMLEWHIKGPENIIQILTKNNFSLFSFYPLSIRHGMLYAVNNIIS